MSKYELQMEVNWRMQSLNIVLVLLILVTQTTVYWTFNKLQFKVMYLLVVQCLCKLTLKVVFVFLMASFGKNCEVRSALQTNGELVFTGVDLSTGHEIFNLAFFKITPQQDDASDIDGQSDN
jgi:hypothetical protein